MNQSFSRREFLQLSMSTLVGPAEAMPRAPVKKFKTIYGSRMACVEAGQGDPIVFLHGNPTSSHLWRNIIPHVEMLGRCLAPDLIGMGDSDKLTPGGPDRYSFVEHRRYLDKLLVELGVKKNVVLVVHDWGSALGFDWARRNERAVQGIAHMEAFVVAQTAQNTPKFALDFFRFFQTPEGERAVLEQNHFVENVLLKQFPHMSEADQAAYRKPYITPGESRRPTLSWPRQAPIDGAPAETHAVFVQYLDWLQQSPIPKLFINAEPGGLVVGPRKAIPRGWPQTTEVTVKGRHYVQEESPAAIGQALAEWLKKLRGKK
jgi:haloalkane dehalogenase